MDNAGKKIEKAEKMFLEPALQWAYCASKEAA